MNNSDSTAECAENAEILNRKKAKNAKNAMESLEFGMFEESGQWSAVSNQRAAVSGERLGRRLHRSPFVRDGLMLPFVRLRINSAQHDNRLTRTWGAREIPAGSFG